jgi:tRNA(Ile2) C34 agmatinyltransferase TiaS
MPATASALAPSDLTLAAPPCPECAEALRPVGGGRYRYWSCRWCGTTMPRR